MPGHNGDKADGKQEAKIIGYAVAIYPYTAEREDEYDVLMWVSLVPGIVMDKWLIRPFTL
jgi:hypothetical protein